MTAGLLTGLLDAGNKEQVAITVLRREVVVSRLLDGNGCWNPSELLMLVYGEFYLLLMPSMFVCLFQVIDAGKQTLCMDKDYNSKAKQYFFLWF